MNGQLDVLNCGRGHLQIKFDKESDADRDKARRMITDMLKRGYVLFVEIGGELERVKSFDAEHDEYILKDPSEIDEPKAEVISEPAIPNSKTEIEPATRATKTPPVREPLRDVGRRGRRAGMRDHKATAIGPTAGG